MSFLSALRGRENRDVLDILFFLLLTLFFPVLLLGRFSLVEEGEGNFFLNISNDLGRSLNLFLAIPILILFFLLASLLWIRRFPKERHGMRFYVTIFLLLVFVISRFIGIFAFPYGQASFLYSSAHYNKIAQVSYLYPMEDRFVSFLTDVALGSYFAISVNLLPTFGKKWTYFLDFVLFVLIAIALSAVLYSLITEREVYFHNCRILLELEEGPPFSLFSFTTNKNVYAFLLMIGVFASLALFVKKANPASPLLTLFFTVNCLIASSRTHFAICGFVLLLFSFFYPLFAFKRHKVYSSLFFSCVLIFVLFLLISYFFLKDNNFAEKMIDNIVDFFLQFSTVHARSLLFQSSMEMITSPFLAILGYGRIPFHNLFQSYMTAIGGEMTITSHNGYGDLEMHYGLVGIILSLVFLVYLIYLSARLLKGLKKEKGVLSLILICAFLIYFAFEPRFFTLDEASTVFLLLSFVFPMMDDEEKDLRTLEGKSEARMYRITKDLKVKGV